MRHLQEHNNDYTLPLSIEMLEKQLSYWKTQLNDLTVLELPTDKHRPMQLSYRGAQETFQLSAVLTQGLKTLSQQHNVTLFMTLLAAFQVLLHRYSGQEDIVIGTALAGRNRQELENLIGFFVNTLVLRTDLSDTPSFVQLLSRVREVCLSAYAHQDLPFEKLVGELQIQRDMSRHPLFQVMLVLQPLELQDIPLHGLTISSFPLANETAKFDLTLSLVEHSDGLTGTIEYSTDLFNAETITRLAGHFQTLLEAVVEQPETSIAQLPLLTAAERHQLLVEWNATQTDYPKDQCIHQLFEEQVARTPDAIALVFEDQQLSYQALNTKANQLAHYLQTVGVKPDTLVAICMERSIDLVIGILAILKAGGAYVPMDSSYPAARMVYLLEDSQAKILLTQSHLIWPENSASIINIDNLTKQLLEFPDSNPESNLTADNLAYVIYTSGSTGNPKGVMVSHTNVSRLFATSQPKYNFNSQDIWTLFHSYAFDFSVWEIWGALIYGGKLVIISYIKSRSPIEFYHLLIKEGVTVLNQTPSAFQQLIQIEQAIEDKNALRLRYIIFGGESLDFSSLTPWFKNHGDQMPQLINMYGITETTVHVTYYALTQGDEFNQKSIIGKALPDVKIYILDKNLHPQSIGIPGELHVAGPGLSRGYLNRPELTSEKFIPNPYSDELNACLYKTGDLVRWLPDGNIEYLGRIDQQIQLRGFRIELGEIEAVLETYPGINKAVATVREDQPGDKRLIAYLAHSQLEHSNVDTLRLFLKKQLPEYMVPSAFVFLDELPLTPNGKLDRKALPAPDQTRPEFTQAYFPPSSPIEEIMAALWQEVLAIEPIGIYDNFFALGGYSLLAMQLMVRLNKQFQIELHLHLLFEEPTIAGLSTLLTTMLEQAPAANLEPIQVISRDQPIPTSFAQQRLWFLDQLLGASSLYNIPWAIQLNGKLDVSAVQQSLRTIVARHEVLRTCFVEQDGEPVQVISDSVDFVCPLVDLSTLPLNSQDGKIQELLAAEGNKPFALKETPLIRATLFKLAEQEHILLVTFHHSVADGWSMGVFSRELASFYEAFNLGQASANLPELPIQYADYTVWQREWLQGEVLEKQLSYWKTQLADLTVLELPTDKHRPMQLSYRGARQTIHLSAALTQRLKSLSQQHNVTFFMTLLAAFQVLLHRYSGQDDIVVGSPIAGRNRQELENLIGFFVNTLVLRTDLSGTPSFVQLLSRVRETCLGAYAHQDLPFEKLVAELQVQRDMNRNPLFQVMLVLQPLELQAMQLPGLTISSFPLTNETAKFDLLFSLVEHPDGLTGTIEYSTDLFNAQTITRLVGHFQTLLEAVVEQPETSIAQLPLLTARERYQILVEWNATQTDYPKDKCIHQLFEEQVARTPDAIAVVFEEQQLSYQALNAKANQLANHLSGLNIGSEKLVGICLERSLYMLVALLGILKAGCGYLPLDPTYPKARLKFILADAQASVLLTHTEQIEKLPKTNAVIICVDELDDTFSTYSDQNPSTIMKPENLVYALYTSGSTGTPKGVAMHHRPLINLLHWQTDGLQQVHSRRVLQFTSLNFDVSFQEIFTALTTGGSLVLISEEQRRDPQLLLTTLIQQKITDLFLPFIALQQLASTAATSNTERSYLKVVVTAGEQLHSTPAIKRFIKNIVGCQLINQYGPSECHVVTSFNLPENIEDWAEFPSIGRPIDNAEIYILDLSRQPVPVGITGEIYIGGDCVALGYLNQPELTAEKFIPNPFSGELNSRLYKTGDLARYQPDGTIEFLGRIDHQVKLRGFRIELGEIEAVLETYPGINKAVATVREDQPGDKRLIAYLTHAPLEHSNLDALRLFLKEKLPEYMVPSAFVFLDELPLTPNGKLDRKALPVPDLARAEFEQAYFPPRSPIEEIVVALWQEVLAIEPIGIYDNFFEVGGHSLLAVQLMVRLNKQFQIELPLHLLFEEPTIAGLSLQLEALQSQTNPKPIASPIRALPRKRKNEI
ncbi:MAG: amino acid adenylation domain-containing protein [Methylococcaceae bacterium]